MKTGVFASLLLLTAHALPAQAPATPVYGYRIIHRYPHSTSSYTEGFFFSDGLFYEGTGMMGRSALLAEDPATGKVVQRNDFDPHLFGEGIVDVGPNILEWTWQSHVGFVVDKFSFRVIREFHYTGEGWGMTRAGNEIVTSDGTATLRFRNQQSFAETRHIVVRDGLKTITQLNELEYIRDRKGGEIYANVWHSDRIARISPNTGKVLGWIDLTGLLPESEKVDAESVLNGIAYDSKTERLFVTGKQWPAIFEIKLMPLRNSRRTQATSSPASPVPPQSPTR